MNKYFKEFLHRGLIFGGFGPLILAIIYFIISKIETDTTFNGKEILLGVITVYLLAFVHAGASVFNQIEKWGLNKSIGCHFVTLYVAYTICYLINSWIPFDFRVLFIYTIIFIALYFVIWSTVYFSVKSSSKKINDKLQEKS